ncbi:MAG: tRNA 2-selenouridine(34) synthase MnmH [Planctomycetota bacterium]|jgi:tRNA 2-selenouridine synthase
MHIPALSYAETRSLEGLRWVDLRSPAEFAHDHVPGAVSVPLFDDAQRAVVGTLYHQDSQESAYEQGLAFAESAMPELLSKMLGRSVNEAEWRQGFGEIGEQMRSGQDAVTFSKSEPGPGPRLALYCWRGGMRSRSVAALVHALGEPVLLLEGGYKAYRSWVRDQVARLEVPQLIVLRGPTGVGKTEILARIEKASSGTTLCLEGLAQHRSSILGAVGKEPVSQPAFDSRLLERLRAMGPGPWFVEGESRKVGDVILPAKLYQAMEDGVQWRLDAETPTRVRNLMEDYLVDAGAVEAIRAKLPFLEGRIGPKWVGQLDSWMAEGRAAEVTEVLLERYYDPLYAHSDRRRDWASHFQVEASTLVDDLLEARSAIEVSPPGIG